MSVESPAFADVNVMKRHLPLQYKGHSRESEKKSFVAQNQILNQVEDDGQRVSKISAPVKLTEASPVFSLKDYFADLPIAPRVDLEKFSALVNFDNIASLKENITNRFLDLVKLNNSIGLNKSVKINEEMVVAILDEKTYKEKLREAEEKIDDYEVALHESGHGWGAVVVGDSVESETIVPGSDYRGLTVTRSKKEKGLYQFAFDRAVVSLAGGIAVEMMGYKARGTGSDIASAQAMCRIAISDPNCPFFSEDQVFSSAYNFTHRALKSVGTVRLHSSALDLLDRGTIV